MLSCSTETVPLQLLSRNARGDLRSGGDKAEEDRLEVRVFLFSVNNCANHGFTHRGTHHCSSFEQWRLYLDGPKSSVLPTPQSHEQALQSGSGHHTPPNTIQSQSQTSTTDTQVLPELQSLDSFTDSDWDFLTSL
uniref:Transcriptional activator protein n=1 Tax=Jatropha leaf curl virus TaxID=543876 RepID=A0A089VMG8_9GEMI|nr:transcriptional activator protein [Jatropha mosaic Lucknow virus]AIR77181.1 transcriptional activator protein [Jatropha leaf curl virus]